MQLPGKKLIPKWLRVLLIVVLVAGAVIGCTVWYKLFRTVPQHFASQEEEFKYGSIGVEAAEGIPYWIWLVLPRVFPEYLPGSGGYASLGIVWEEGHETPVGFSKMTIGFPRIGINCAICHSGSYRTSPSAAPRIVPGAPATRIDVLGYQRFLFDCAADDRFTADTLLEAIDYDFKLSFLDKKLYRHILIPETKKKILEKKAVFSWTNTRPVWGRGRIDPFNPVKFNPKQLNMDPSKDTSIGNSDMEAIWNMEKRANSPLHWDGLNTSLKEVVLTGAIGDGATPKTLPVERLGKLEEWLKKLQPPAYPFEVNWDLAMTKGKPLFQKHCAECHGPEGARFATSIPIDEIKTDRHRLEMWTTKNGESEAALIYNRVYSKYPWGFKHFVKTSGYLAVPLTGIWLRAPYLHNGSVPTLEDLLEPKEKRPTLFYRGFDVYDNAGLNASLGGEKRPIRTGFMHGKEDILALDPLLLQIDSLEKRQQQLDRLYFRYETSVAGNDNGGHEGKAFGTELSAEEKRALIEYLKSL